MQRLNIDSQTGMRRFNFRLNRELILGFAFAAMLAVPVVVFGGTKVIFVDDNASGNEDGSFDHPYHSIGDALDHAKDGTEVHVKNGKYRENITLPKGVKLFGESGKAEKVVIEARNDNRPTVEMKHGTELDHVTIEGGRYGIQVREDAGVTIYDVVVSGSQRDGISIDAADLDKKHRAIIVKTEVKRSDRAGIYAEKRSVLIQDCSIHDNGSDGIDLAAGTKAWLENDAVKGNKGSGAKLILDGASIFGKKNSFRANKREGIEVSSFGATGTIGLTKSKLIGNGRYGVARVARTATGTRLFGNLSFGIGTNGSLFDQNGLSGLSPVVRGF